MEVPSGLGICSGTLYRGTKCILILLSSLQILVMAAGTSSKVDLEDVQNGTVSAVGLATDEQILLAFKDEVGDPDQVLQNWTSKLSVCNWTGVACDPGIHRVRNLTLTSCRLEGFLTPQLGALEFLEIIDLTENSFSGSIPAELFKNCSTLIRVRLGNNKFSGPVPSTLENCFALTELNLGSNSLSGNISKSLTNLISLTSLDLSSNDLTGEIPQIPSSPDGCSSLTHMDLSSNQLQGAIPDSLKNCANLSFLRLSRNAITGPVPLWLPVLQNLSRLDLSYNKLEGYFPENIFELGGRLGELSLRGNRLIGNLPDRFDEFRLLDLLDLSKNRLTGDIPKSLGSCRSLVDLRLSENLLTGWIPVELGNLISFQFTLNLSNNLLTGSIPPSLGSLQSVQQIDLSANNLTGEIPSDLGNCTNLQFLDISNNNLGGSIPSESFCALRSLLYFSFSGNDLHLTGFDPNGVLPSSWRNATCDGGKVQEISKSSKGKVWIIVYTSVVVATLVAITCSVYVVGVYCAKKRGGVQGQELVTWNGTELEVILLTVEDLLVATDSFSDENIVGFGSSGMVYKGVLPFFPFVIAVKRFNDDGEGRQRLDREAKIMNLIRHRNLVRSLGARSSGVSSLGPGLHVLVMEYMEDGTLDHLLYDDPLPDFSWDMRLNIAVDVATGLCYLHGEIRNHLQLIHGDIKPGNIFLKSGFQASIGDFGLATFAVNGKPRNCNGSPYCEFSYGYCPPELGQGYISTAGDVYSFGVVILEMLVRRRPSSFDMENKGSSFLSWIRDSFPHNVNGIIDQTLASQLESNRASIMLLFKLGLRCTADMPWDRPTIQETLRMIKTIPSGIREREVTVSPIEELAQEDATGPSSAQLRNAQTLRELAEVFDFHEFRIDISESHDSASGKPHIPAEIHNDGAE